MADSDPDWSTFLLHEVELPAMGPEKVLRTARYDLGEMLGRGGVGVVRQARDQLLHRDVALKVMRRDKQERVSSFWHEARVTALLDHPGIVPVYDAGTIDGGPFFTMKKVEGHNLRQAMEAGRIEGRGERIELFLRVCDAVAYAHDKGWIHRDIKPTNIMVGAFGEVLVVDWGLAWELGSDEPPLRAGTPAFVAPEQALGRPHDQRADVFALGGVLWYLLSERQPWDGVSSTDLVDRISRGGCYVPPRGVLPRELDAIVRRALARSPSDRYASVQALGDDLRRFRDGEEVHAAGYSVARRVLRWADRRRGALGWVALALVVGLGVLSTAGTVTGAALLQANRMEAEAARTAQRAEGETRRQLVSALVATGAALMVGEQFEAARHALLRADLVGSNPASGLAWADLRARGEWPVHRLELGGTPVGLHVGASYVLVVLDDGRWSTWSLADGRRRSEGHVPGRPVALVDERSVVSDDQGDLVLTDVFAGEKARVRRARPDVRIDQAFVGGGELWVQAFENEAPPVTAWALPDLTPVELPKRVTELYVHGLSPDGARFVGSRERVPSKVLTGEVRSRAGRTVLPLDREVRVVLGAQHIVVAESSGVRAYDGQGELLWRGPGWSGLTGVVSRRLAYVADEGGTIAAWGRDDGRRRPSLLGLDQRPVAVAHDLAGRWLCAVGGDGRLLVWAVPETPGHRLSDGPAGDGRAHPGGRLVAYRRGDDVVVQDVPSGRVLWRAPVAPRGRGLAWSPDGRRLAVGGDPLVVHDLVTGRRHELPRSRGPMGWSTTQLVTLHDEQVRRWHPETLDLLEEIPFVYPSAWGALVRDDGSVVISTNKRFDDAVGIEVSPDGAVDWIRGGGAPEHVGFDVSSWGDRLLFARQDGRLVVHGEGAGPFDAWSWQADPLMAVVPDDDHLLTVTYGGRLDLVDDRGVRHYNTQLGGDRTLWMVRVDDAVVLGGGWGVRWLAVDAGPPATLAERLVAGHGWSATDPQVLDLDDAQRLTWAIGRRQGLDTALAGRTDGLADVLRALAR